MEPLTVQLTEEQMRRKQDQQRARAPPPGQSRMLSRAARDHRRQGGKQLQQMTSQAANNNNNNKPSGLTAQQPPQQQQQEGRKGEEVVHPQPVNNLSPSSKTQTETNVPPSKETVKQSTADTKASRIVENVGAETDDWQTLIEELNPGKFK